MQLYKFTETIIGSDCNITLLYKNYEALNLIPEDERKGNVFLEVIFQYDKRSEFCYGPKFLVKEKDFDTVLERMTGPDPIVDLTDLVIRELHFNTLPITQERLIC